VRLRRAGQAGEDDFDALYRQVWPKAVTSAQRIVRDRSVAEEIAQEAFTRAFERWPSVSCHPSPTAWILRVALNLAISDTRRQRLPPKPEELTSHDEHTVVGLVVRDALAKLSAKQRQAIVLRYIGGCEETEIAAAMKISSGSVKTHLSRGRDRLKLLIGGDPDELLAHADP
jgi:RNA polymerase sigma-70 factor (ECF subfamily)